MDTVELLPVAVKQGSVEGPFDRAGQLLDAMHQVCSHDLPNQLIIVQSFINLLEMEEKPGLTDAAQEYLTRLAGAARRAGIMVQFLKEMARLNRLQEPVETIDLADFLRELRAELTQRLPARRLSFAGDWTAAAVRGGRRSLQQALLEVLRCGIELCPTAEVVIRFRSRAEAFGVRLDIAVARDGSLNPTQQLLFRDDGPPIANRLEIHLAQALVATWGGTLEVTPGSSAFSLCLQVPSTR
jgi:signal transduction histidine kinase